MSKKLVKLKKGSESGFGFSIIGGVGTKIPPIVYEVIPGSPADKSKKLQQGDVIVTVNNKTVSSFTTKEVLNCLRDSPNEVNLELISDKSLEEDIQRFLHDPGLLKEAVTQDELRGVNSILVKKNGVESPPLPAKVSVALDQAKDNTTWHSLDRKGKKSKNCNSGDSFEDEKFESCADIVDGVSSTKHSDQEKAAAGSSALPERSAGETPVCQVRSDVLTKSEELTNTQYPQMPSSKSVPNSPSIAIISNSLSNKKMHQIRDNCNVSKMNSTNCCEETNSSCSSLACVSCESSEIAVTTINETDRLFSYSPSAVRISKSEDQLQYSDNAELSSANHDLEDDINASLNTLLDTKEDQSTNMVTSSANTSLVGSSLNSNPMVGSGMANVSISTSSIIPLDMTSSKNDVTVSPSGVIHSSLGDSYNPLTHSPPFNQSHSFVSPNSSLHFSSNGIYSKIDNRKDDSFSITSSGNICSNSSSLATSPDTDIPDDLEWDVSAPPVISKQNGHGANVAPLSSGYSNVQKVLKKPLSFDDSVSLSSAYGIKTRKNEDENRIIIKVAGPEKSSSPTISRSNSEIDMKTGMFSNCRSSLKSDRDNGIKFIGGEVSTASLHRDINSCDSNQLMSMGVIPGSDFDVTPTNSPHQSPLNSPNLPDKPFAGAIRCRSSSPIYDQNSPPSHHQLSSPQTPCSGTLSPDTLAYQQLSESEDEFTNSFISEDDMKKSIGSISRNVDSLWDERDDGDCSESGNCSENIKAVSPPMSEDESDIESLHSFHFSPKAVDIPSAVRLARRLYILDGFKKTDVSRHLSKNNEFSRTVAEEYLQHFDFEGKTLDAALRIFLDRFCLTGETQERERVLVHFSKRFLDSNPGSFNSQDAAHTLTCALMLLNTDLHGANRTSRSMTCNEFIKNLAELNDGQDFDQVVLINLYSAVKKEPLKWVGDESSEDKREGRPDKNGPQFMSDNPFLAPVSGDGVVYKKGYIMRKCCSEPNGKRTSFGKRSWKMWWCTVQDLALYLHKDEQCGRRGGQHLPDIGSQAIRLHHGLATRANDYNKKQHVFRLRTADQAEYLFQTSDSKELQGWIDTINLVCASLSAPPMAEAVGSQRRFQRPLLPCSVTKLNLEDQTSDHDFRLSQFESQLSDHIANPPEKTAKTSVTNNFRERELYLKQEIQRYKTYVLLLRSRMCVAGDAEERAVITLGELFRHPAGDKAIEVPIARDGVTSKIVPPPIPDRSGRYIPDRLAPPPKDKNLQLKEGISEWEHEKLSDKNISDKNLNSNSKGGAKLGKLKWLASFFKFNKSNKKTEEEEGEEEKEILPPPLPPKPSPKPLQ